VSTLMTLLAAVLADPTRPLAIRAHCTIGVAIAPARPFALDQFAQSIVSGDARMTVMERTGSIDDCALAGKRACAIVALPRSRRDRHVLAHVHQ
jgi:hypothetical protein